MRPTAPQPQLCPRRSAFAKAALPEGKQMPRQQGWGWPPRTRLALPWPSGLSGPQRPNFGLHTPTAHELVSLKGLGFTDGWTPSLKINIDAQIGLLWGKIFVLFIFLSLPRIEGLVAHFCLPQVDIILLLVNLMMY